MECQGMFSMQLYISFKDSFDFMLPKLNILSKMEIQGRKRGNIRLHCVPLTHFLSYRMRSGAQWNTSYNVMYDSYLTLYWIPDSDNALSSLSYTLKRQLQRVVEAVTLPQRSFKHLSQVILFVKAPKMKPVKRWFQTDSFDTASESKDVNTTLTSYALLWWLRNQRPFHSSGPRCTQAVRSVVFKCLLPVITLNVLTAWNHLCYEPKKFPTMCEVSCDC